MHVTVATMIGLLAGSMTTAAWLPQVAKAFRTKSTRDFSWGWFALFGFGVAFWLVYGLAVDAVAVVLPNALTFLLIFGLFLLKLVHSGTHEDDAHGSDALADAVQAAPEPGPRPVPQPAPEATGVLAGVGASQA
jgi:MtN3 and saliva related transmembrane protein